MLHIECYWSLYDEEDLSRAPHGTETRGHAMVDSVIYWASPSAESQCVHFLKGKDLLLPMRLCSALLIQHYAITSLGQAARQHRRIHLLLLVHQKFNGNPHRLMHIMPPKETQHGEPSPDAKDNDGRKPNRLVLCFDGTGNSFRVRASTPT